MKVYVTCSVLKLLIKYIGALTALNLLAPTELGLARKDILYVLSIPRKYT